jgi:hypothetical protein
MQLAWTTNASFLRTKKESGKLFMNIAYTVSVELDKEQVLKINFEWMKINLCAIFNFSLNAIYFKLKNDFRTVNTARNQLWR